jgi:hypothetical protein
VSVSAEPIVIYSYRVDPAGVLRLLLENDLAIGDAPVSRASPEAVAAATSGAVERHLAANCLNGGSEMYSETDVST